MNYLKTCRENDPGTEVAFRETFCARCRNSECDLAGWATDLFALRVATQEARFFDPKRIDPAHYRALPDLPDKANAPQPLKGWLNTPPTGAEGVTIGGGKAPPPVAPASDPWAIVAPGAKINLD